MGLPLPAPMNESHADAHGEWMKFGIIFQPEAYV